MTLTNKQVTTRLKQLTGAALLALCAAGAQAAGYAGTQFEIEMVVFARDSGMDRSRETWPTALRLDYDNQWVDFDTPSAADPMSPALQPAPNQLDNKVAALNRARDYKVLFHKTWRQVLQNERNAPAVLISGGELDGNHHQLEGSVTLSVSRYLHLSTDLWLSEWMPQTGGLDDQTQLSGIPVPTRPRAAIQNAGDEPMDLATSAGGANRDFGYSTSANSAVFHGDGEFAKPAEPTQKMAARVAVLNEERRLRSGELHYIDHPKLGVLIEVRTVQQQPEPSDEEEPMEFSP
ncbi:CsiV family protein [Microbulbifer mangrovi]|uniref:CsiV family protein n=1 Tax=Microbulbifer mangrovi TaxID=927787 RepID=UPI00130108EA|nr:CsiV family protein [Microbulbifer mangrovi]